MTMKRTYLGDSVYAAFDGFSFTLTTENGCQFDPSNTIVLDPMVLANLVEFAKYSQEGEADACSNVG